VSSIEASVQQNPLVLLEFKKVNQVYQTKRSQVHALKDFELSVHKGEFIAILGPSGCGKSTLLSIASGLIIPTSGEVIRNGKKVTGPQTDVGIVFQSHVLLDWRTALDNVLLQIEMRGLSRSEYEPKARELLDSVGLKGFEDHRPYELSGGMMQRVSICRALVHNPSMLLMDEPFGALDALTRDQMILDMQKLWMRTGQTVFMITHNIDEAVFLGTSVVVMTPRPGEIAEILKINIPYPRKFDVRKSPDFLAYTEEIRGIFLKYGVLREDI
jgi:NitT/TauT family transport system ATP-binding protein